MSRPLLNIALRAATEAVKVLRSGFYSRDRIQIEHKGRNDFVSNIDKASEEAIIKVIKESYPNDIIVAEESASAFNPEDYKDPNRHVWIIDPLDGTRNFLMGNPHFAVSIAVQEHGSTVAAVVWNPITDECFTAAKGDGTRFNNSRLKIETSAFSAESRDNFLAGKVIATGFPFKEPEKLKRSAALVPFMFEQGVCDYRRTASAALDLAYVAAGRLDGFYEEGLKPWDMAGGCLLVKEAGGLVIDYDAGENYLSTGEVIAGSAPMCKALVTKIREFDNLQTEEAKTL